MSRTTRRIVLAAPPTGAPTLETFRLEEAALPERLAEGQALIRTIACSADPGTRTRLSGEGSYAPPLKVGDTIDSFCVGEVMESANSRFAPGDLVAFGGGWAQHHVFPGRGYIQKIPHRRLPLSAWIGVLGVPGMTAWFGLTRVAGLKAGERVLVTSAAGPVGATAGQLAKVWGAARVVGVASGTEKAAWLRDAGFDAVVDYKTEPDLAAALSAASPEGYDVLFDNVGAAMLDACLPLMRPLGRIVLSGQVADYNAPLEAKPGLRNLQAFIARRLRMEGLVVFDDLKEFPPAQEQVSALIEAGRIKTREVRYQGLESAPQAFIDLFQASMFGRRIIEVAPESV